MKYVIYRDPKGDILNYARVPDYTLEKDITTPRASLTGTLAGQPFKEQEIREILGLNAADIAKIKALS